MVAARPSGFRNPVFFSAIDRRKPSSRRQLLAAQPVGDAPDIWIIGPRETP
jgi:hypothetical protein